MIFKIQKTTMFYIAARSFITTEFDKEDDMKLNEFKNKWYYIYALET